LRRAAVGLAIRIGNGEGGPAAVGRELRIADPAHDYQRIDGEWLWGGLSFTGSDRAERHHNYDYRGDNAFHNNLLNCVAHMKQIR
jgi:hypothetical protein